MAHGLSSAPVNSTLVLYSLTYPIFRFELKSYHKKSRFIIFDVKYF